MEKATLVYFGWLAAGLVLGLVFARLAARPGPRAERWILALGLVAAGGAYVAFAALDGTDRWLWIEIGGLAAFTTLAVLGLLRSPLWLSAGWVLHAAWDSPLHLATTGTSFVPIGYILLCVGFDVIVAAAVYLRARRGRYAGDEPG